MKSYVEGSSTGRELIRLSLRFRGVFRGQIARNSREKNREESFLQLVSTDRASSTFRPEGDEILASGQRGGEKNFKRTRTRKNERQKPLVARARRKRKLFAITAFAIGDPLIEQTIDDSQRTGSFIREARSCRSCNKGEKISL